MRFNRLDLNLLVALDALLQEKKITEVAQRLHVSQSAVSGMLSRLRAFFGDELLVKMGRNLELTALGRELADPVRHLLMHIEATLTIRPVLSIAAEQRHFRITASDYAMPILIAPLVRRLQALAPLITVELRPLIRNTGQGLRRGETDLVIIPEQYIDFDQPHEVLLEDSFTCIVWAENDEVHDHLDMETFLRCSHAAPYLGLPSAPGLDEVLFEDQKIARRIAITTQDFTSLPLVVVGTNLIATMQARLARDSASRLPLRLLAPPIAMPALRLCMQWHLNQTTDPVHEWLRNQFIAVAREVS